MRMKFAGVLTTVLALGLGAAAPSVQSLPKDAPDWIDFGVLPGDLEAQRALDFEHRRLVRRAVRQCFPRARSLPRTGLYADPCVRRNVARGLELAESPELSAFHWALPLRVRFDGLRGEADWRPAVTRARAAAKTEE